jgi:hypothetical protein
MWFEGDIFCLPLLLVIAVAIIPPRFDPAIRLKEWLEQRRRR